MLSYHIQDSFKLYCSFTIRFTIFNIRFRIFVDQYVIMISFYYAQGMSYDELRKKSLEISQFVEWHTNRILENIKRSLKVKQSFRDPFKFKIKETIPYHLIIHIFKAIKSYEGETTPPSILYKTVTDKPGRKVTTTKTYTLKFLNFHSVLHVFTHLNDNKNVLDLLTIFLFKK